MPVFPIDTFMHLYNSTNRLNSRFRGKERPTVHQSTNFFREETREFMEAHLAMEMKRDNIEHVIEEAVDVIVTAFGVTMSMGLKAESFINEWAHLWNGRSDLKAYSILEPEVFNAVDAYHEFQIASENFNQFMKSGNVSSARKALLLIMTNAVVLTLTHKIPFHLIEAGVNFVITKNDSKNAKTHYLDKSTGKITRRQVPL